MCFGDFIAQSGLELTVYPKLSFNMESCSAYQVLRSQVCTSRLSESGLFLKEIPISAADFRPTFVILLKTLWKIKDKINPDFIF